MLKDKIALITGASSGIGLATVNKFLKEGATVIGVGPKTEAIENIEGNFTFMECDVTDPEQIKNICKSVEEKYDVLDSLVTVCDKSYEGSTLTIDPDIYDKASRHICLAPMLFTQYLNDMLHKSDHPSIIHDVSINALVMSNDDVMTASLNTAMINYVRQSTPLVSPVRINAVVYGLIKNHLLSPEKEAKYSTPEALEKLPAKRLGEPSDVANFNAFISSDRALYINSTAIQIDGGYYTVSPRSMGSAI